MPEKGPCTSVKSVESIVIEIYWWQKLQPTHIVEQPDWGFETFSSLPPSLQSSPAVRLPEPCTLLPLLFQDLPVINFFSLFPFVNLFL